MPKGAGQERKHRGRYNRERDIDRATAEQPRSLSKKQYHAKIAQRSAAHVAATKALVGRAQQSGWDNTPKPPTPRDWSPVEATALHLARLEVHLETLLSLEAQGKLTGDECSTIPGISREIRSVRAELGLPGVLDADGKVIKDASDL
jgi:hypothetical protein